MTKSKTQTTKTTQTVAQYYVGTCYDVDRTVFTFTSTEGQASPDVKNYPGFDTIYGPFSSREAAQYFADNSELHDVAVAEQMYTASVSPKPAKPAKASRKRELASV